MARNRARLDGEGLEKLGTRLAREKGWGLADFRVRHAPRLTAWCRSGRTAARRTGRPKVKLWTPCVVRLRARGRPRPRHGRACAWCTGTPGPRQCDCLQGDDKQQDG
jgi:hypothetical protein